MFEGILEKILQQKLGMYLEGFDKQNLSIGIWGGNIMLDNMKIRKNVFQSLGLPLKLIFGKIKKLHIRVPWTKLQSSPVELVLETLMLVVSPVDQSQWLAKETWNFEYKKKMLDEMTQLMVEKLKLALSNKAQDSSSQSKEDGGFVDRIATKILDNIQITIKNIHIRYESGYALGFTLQELAINTANQNWEKTFYDRTVKENKEKPLYKRLAITGLAMYLHHPKKGGAQQKQIIGSNEFQFEEIKQQPHFLMLKDSEKEINDDDFYLMANESSEINIETKMSQMFPSSAAKIANLPYFIEPVYLDLRLIQLTKSEIGKPMFQLYVNLAELNIALTKRQYELLFQLGDYFKQYVKFIEKFNMKKKYKYLRPVYPVLFKPSLQNFTPITFQSEVKGSQSQQQPLMTDMSSDASQLMFSAMRILEDEQEELKKDMFLDDDNYLFYDARESSFKSARSTIREQIIAAPTKNIYARQWWRFAITSIIKENRFKRGFWSEFKLTNWRKMEYARHLINLTSQNMTKEYQIDNTKLKPEEDLLYRHIIEANDVNDIQSWLGVLLKKKLQKEQASAAQEKKVIQSTSAKAGFWGSLFQAKPAVQQTQQAKEESKIEMVDEEIHLTEEEIEQIQLTLKQIEADSLSDSQSEGGLGLSEVQRSKQIKISLDFVFTTGRINLLNKGHRVELYQDDLTLRMEFRRDTSFELAIGNRNVGINVVDLATGIPKELISKHKSAHIASEGGEKLQWELKIEKRGTLEAGFNTDIYFESQPIKLKYDAGAFSQLTKFFQTGSNEELRDQAYNKISALKETTQTSLKDLLYKKSNNLKVKIASPILELPFRAHNSDFIGESKEDETRQRMWIINLGNIDFQTNFQQEKSSQEQQSLDEYDWFRLIIDSIGLKYVKKGIAFKVLEEVEIQLDIGIKNKVKAALLSDSNKQIRLDGDDEKSQPSSEVVVRAQLPEVVLNASPDVYNGLVNLGQVLSSEGSDKDLLKLKLQKDQIIENSYYHHEEVQIKGLKGVLSSNWQSYFVLISGSYIYIYKNRRDLMPLHYIYMGDCQISGQKDLKEAISKINGLDLANSIILKHRLTLELLYLKFPDDPKDADTFLMTLVKCQQDLQGGEVNILQSKDILSDIIHKDKKEVGFKLTIEVQRVEARIWQTTEKAIADLMTGRKDGVWLCARVRNFGFSIVKYQYEIKLRITLNQVSIAESLRIKEEMLINEPGQQLCVIDIDVYDIYSPNIEDCEIFVNIKLCKLYLMFDSIMINETFKFFRNVKSFEVNDIESYHVKLMDESEALLDRKIAKKMKIGSILRKGSMRNETCQTVDLILVKVHVHGSGLTLIAIHHQYFTPVFDLTVGKSMFGYDMHYDHDKIYARFSDARAYDLTNYPFTIDPTTTQKASLRDVNTFKRLEIIGIRDENAEAGNGIMFESLLFTDKCPLHKKGITSSLKVEIASVKIVYFFEMSFRIIDYFFDKFLWAITESDPYLPTDQEGKKIIEQIDMSKMSAQKIEEFDMKQIENTMEMIFIIHKPYVILKDRPHLKDNFEIDLGEIQITYAEKQVRQRFKKAPRKQLIEAKFIINCNDVGIKFSQFIVAPPFNLRVDFSYISHSPLLPSIDSHELDKSYNISIIFSPHIHLRLREDIYTFLLRCIDLNLAFTDYMDEKYNFRRDEEYFRCTDYLLKSRTQIDAEYIALTLVTQNGEQLTELGAKKPNIIIDYHLNRRHNYIIQIEEISSFFAQGRNSKLLLFGNVNQIHSIETFEEMKECVCLNEFASPSKITILIQMHPDGNKFFQVEISGIKMFLHPYFYLMIDHFFRENMPVYDMNSQDKPNEYNDDYEEYPEMNLIFKLTDSLICFSNTDEAGSDYKELGIACQANLDFQFKREKIKGTKTTLWEKVSSVSSLAKDADQPIQVPISWMRIGLKQVSPYICDLSQLEVEKFLEIKKRQLIQHFDTTFHSATFLQYRWDQDKIFCFDKTELKLDKVIAKTSFKDIQLLQTLMSEFSQSYGRFNTFYLGYIRSKKNAQSIKDRDNQSFEHQNSLYRKTQNALNLIRSMSMSSSNRQSMIRNNENEVNQQMQQYMEVPQHKIQSEAQKKDAFLKQKLDYEAQSDIVQTCIKSNGIQIVLINDAGNIFYPVLTLNVSTFEYKSTGEFGSFTGKSNLKAMISYYNSVVSEWEPLIEKTKVELTSSHGKGQVFHLIQFKSNLNLNITTQFLQVLMQTQKSFKESLKTKAKDEQLQLMQQHISTALIRQSVRSTAGKPLDKKAGEPYLPNVPAVQEVKAELEYKVTPYTIINYSSRIIFVRNVYSFDVKQKEYIIPPGESAEYEVDYEEEVKHLMRDKNEEVVKKQDFLNVNFEGDAFGIKDINLRNPNFYIHTLKDENPEDFVAYGVKFENMRKLLIIRAPFVFNNLTDVNYKLRMLQPDGKSVLKTINLEPGQCYPIDMKEMLYKFQLSNEFTKDEWSSPIRIRTIVEKVPKNATTYLYHGNQYTIITKEKTEHPANFNINFKTPVIIKNALPCNLKIRTDVITGKKKNPQMTPMGERKNQEEEFDYEQREFEIERGETLKLHNFNLKQRVEFLFTLDTRVSHQSLETNRQTAQITEGALDGISCFSWGEFMATNQEFKVQKMFLIKDSDNKECPPLEVWCQMRKCKQAGVMIIFYVKNVIVNNTDQRLLIYYNTNKGKILPATGQVSASDNSIILLSECSKVQACLEDFDLTRQFSQPFNVDVAAVTNTIQIKKKDQNSFYEFTIKTELSQAAPDEELYTKVTLISPCFVLHNRTPKTLLITQEDCLDQCQIILSGQRVPFFWKDFRKPRLVRIKCVEREAAEYDDDSHDWTFSFALNEVGRMSIINKNKRAPGKSKHFLVDKQLQDDNQILFITFHEETQGQFATYRIENHSKYVNIEYHQKDYPHNTEILRPESSSIFSWTNPTNAEYKITCKFFGQDGPPKQQEGGVPRIDIEPDNLELNERFELPQHLWSGSNKKNRFLFIYTITNGFSKILVFSDISQELEMRKKHQEQDEAFELNQLTMKTLRLEVMSIGVSFICQTYTEKRKEFAFLYLEDLKFIALEAEQRREMQMRIGYAQIDNNVSDKPLFQVVVYPKELYMKRDKVKAKQYQEEDEIKEFFNMHITSKLDVPDVLFIEEMEFLVQTLVLQMDDEFIGYIYRFTEILHTNITGVHDILVNKKPNMLLQFEESNNQMESSPQQQYQEDEEELLQPQNRSTTMIGDQEEEEKVSHKQQDNNDMLRAMKSSQSMTLKRRLKHMTQKAGDMIRLQSMRGGVLQQSPPNRKTTASSARDTSSLSLSTNMNAFSQQHSSSWLNYNLENNAKKLYIKAYKSSPLDIELSYVTKVIIGERDESQANKRFSLKDKVRNYGLQLVNLDHVQLRINSLELNNIFGTPNDIMFQLQSHYTTRLKKNLLGIFGQTILGSPANFINHLGTGAKDFFYMPINGMVKGPLEGGKGIIMGTQSLLRNTVQGTFGSASKVFSQVSKGLLLITSDGEFINKREKNIQERPSNVIEGVGYGLKSTFKSVASGITGVVENPLKGAQKEGFKGFMKGAYKGLSGLVVKPASGVLDLLSKTSEGIKNNVNSNKEKKVKRIRYIRPFYGTSQLVKAYNELHAEVTHNLRKMDKKRYASLTFLDAMIYNELGERKQKVVVLTEELLLLLEPQHREILQVIPSQNVMTVTVSKDIYLVIHIVDRNDDLQEGLRMKIEVEKTLKRYQKIIQSYIYHVRTEIMVKQNKSEEFVMLTGGVGNASGATRGGQIVGATQR